jgi:GNAT superfamily N-acetyltransferase
MELIFREAKETDITDLIKLLAGDVLGASREDLSAPLNHRYTDAFHSIEQDPNNELTVVEYNGELVGMLQLTFIPYLTHTGSWRCLIEGVRIAKTHRGKGLGTKFINWAISRAKQWKCGIVQLTSDKKRPEAIQFYESLGFVASHEGFKLKL